MPSLGQDEPGLSAYMRIARDIERMMELGRLKPADKLPPTPELAKRFGTTPKTIQKGLSLLVRKGLLSRKTGVGTVVTAKPRSIALGVLSGKSPLSEDAGGFVRLLTSSLLEQGALNGSRVSIFTGLDEPGFDAKILEVEDAIAEGKINFVYSMQHSQPLIGWLCKKCRLGWVMSHKENHNAIAFKGCSYLLGRGYRKIWMLSRFVKFDAYYEEARLDEERGFRKAFEDFGLQPDGGRIVKWGPSLANVYEMAREALSDPATRPDAILSETDSMTPGIILAAATLGIRIPEDLGIATHKNKGIEILSPVPLTALVIDPAEIASKIFAFIKEGDLRKHQPPEVFEPVLEPGLSCGENAPPKPSGSRSHSIEQP